MLLLVAFSAIIVPLILLVGFRMSARQSMPITALVVALLASTVWGMDKWAILASTLQGVHRAFTILWILAGAIFFLYVMQKTGAMERIRQGFFKISPDMRIQTVLIAFAFVAIIEGVSGFGAPAAIAVPLLMAIGFHPLSSMILALVGDSVPVSFGALGTPLTVGLSNIPGFGEELVNLVAVKITLIDSLYGLVLPMILVAILVLAFGRKSERWRDITEVLPWSLLVGGVYIVTAILSNMLLGLEFTSVVAGAVSLIVGSATARWGILQPKTAWRHHALEADREVRLEKPTMSIVKAWLPYGLVVGLLLVQRIIPSLREFSLTAIDWSWTPIVWLPQIHSAWAVLHSPGTILIIVSLVTIALFHNRWKTVVFASSQMVQKLLQTGLALIVTLVMVQIFANSGINANGLASMPIYIAESLAQALGPVWLSVAPMLGAVTAFIMGSSTVSTLTMSPVQYSVANQLIIPVDIAMAQQISGANAGNIIAVHNVVAASAVSGLHHQEWRAIRHAFPVVLIYLTCTVIMTLVVMLFV